MNDKVKVTVLYYSMTGTNSQLARWAKEAAEAFGADVRLRKLEDTRTPNNPAWEAEVERSKDVPVVSIDDVIWADALVFSVPTRYGVMASQLKAFLDSTGGAWAQGQLNNKVVTAMTSAQNPHGGQEGTLHSLYHAMMHWSAIIVPPGFADARVFAAGGNPYGTSVTASGPEALTDEIKAAVTFQTERALTVADQLLRGRKN